MRHALVLVTALLAASAGCDLGKITVNTTSKVLVRAQPSLQQESDYELARQAIPGTLKSIEGFWIVSPDNGRLIRLLTEGYCEYGTGFVEDDWEAARLVKDLSAAEYHNERSTKIFNRCLNYALLQLGKRWQRDLFGDQTTVTALLRDDGKPGKLKAFAPSGPSGGFLPAKLTGRALPRDHVNNKSWQAVATRRGFDPNAQELDILDLELELNLFRALSPTQALNYAPRGGASTCVSSARTASPSVFLSPTGRPAWSCTQKRCLPSRNTSPTRRSRLSRTRFFFGPQSVIFRLFTRAILLASVWRTCARPSRGSRARARWSRWCGCP